MTTAAIRLALVLALLLSVAAVAARTAPAHRTPSPRIFGHATVRDDLRPMPRLRVLPQPRIYWTRHPIAPA